MLAINDNKKICIFSKGKTGTTSLQNLLENKADWKTIGEAEVDWYGIGPEHFAGISRQEDIVKHLHKQDYETFFIIRNPWQRYVSGFKEIFQILGIE